MSGFSVERVSSEQQEHLLHPTPFDHIDDIETSEISSPNRNRRHQKGPRRSRARSWFGARKTWRSTHNWPLRGILIGLGLVVAVIIFAAIGWHNAPSFRGHEKPDGKGAPTGNSPDQDSQSSTSSSTKNTSVSPWQKPEGFKIIGLIFFGRPPAVEILDCY